MEGKKLFLNSENIKIALFAGTLFLFSLLWANIVFAASSPIAVAGPKHSLEVGVAHTHDGASAIDIDGDLRRYEWLLANCPAECPLLSNATGQISGSSTNVPGPTFTPNAAGVYALRLEVRDSSGEVDYDATYSTAIGGGTDPNETLYVNLNVSLSGVNWHGSVSGSAPLTGVDLRGTVSGTASGSINYTFYCHRSDSRKEVTEPWDAKFDNTLSNPISVEDICNYNSQGTYSPKIIVERSNLSAEARAVVEVASSGSTNESPVAHAGNNFYLVAGAPYTHTGASALDSDGNLANYRWTLASCPSTCPTLLNSSGGISGFSADISGPTFTANAGGIYVLRLAVTDSGNAVDYDSVLGEASGGLPPLPSNSPPNAVLDVTSINGVVVNFTASNSSDLDGDVLTYSWNFGDGGNSTQVSPAHTYAASGSYVVSLIVSDGKSSDKVERTVKVYSPDAPPLENFPPTAYAGHNHDIETGVSHTHTGANSADTNGNLASYEWTLVNCPSACPSLSGAAGIIDGFSIDVPGPTYTPNFDGIYSLRLKVLDSNGAIDYDSVIEVASGGTVQPPSNNPPQAVITIIYTSGLTVVFDASNSIDTDGDALNYVWDFGDGTISTLLTPSHTYASEGTYMVSLKVSDGQASNTTTKTITVSSQTTPPLSGSAPSANTGNAHTLLVGSSHTHTGASVSDPDGDLLAYSWIMVCYPAFCPSFSNGYGIISGSHADITGPTYTPNYAGSYTLTLTVSDVAGNSDSQSITETAESSTPPDNHPPTAVIGDPVFNNLTVSFSGDGSSDPDGDPLTYIWNFGDETESVGVNSTHTYASPGTYTVALVVSDGKFFDTATTIISLSVPVTQTNSCLPSANSIENASPNVYSYYFNTIAHAVNASLVSWFGTGEEVKFIKTSGSQQACFSGGLKGGLIDGGMPYDAMYECTLEHCGGTCPSPCYAYHSAAGIGAGVGSTQLIEDLKIQNTGDGISLRNDTARNVIARRLYLYNIHDDGFESDFGLAGFTIEDNLLENTNTAFAMRLRSSATGNQTNELWTIRNNLVRLHEFPNGYKQRPGHGNVFKLDKTNNEPRFRMTGNTIVVGPDATGSILFPPVSKVEECSNNTYLFVGTQAAWENVLADQSINDGGNNGERLAKLNQLFPGCFNVKIKPSSVGIDEFLTAEGWTQSVNNWKASHVAGSAN